MVFPDVESKWLWADSYYRNIIMINIYSAHFGSHGSAEKKEYLVIDDIAE